MRGALLVVSLCACGRINPAFVVESGGETEGDSTTSPPLETSDPDPSDPDPSDPTPTDTTSSTDPSGPSGTAPQTSGTTFDDEGTSTTGEDTQTQGTTGNSTGSYPEPLETRLVVIEPIPGDFAGEAGPWETLRAMCSEQSQDLECDPIPLLGNEEYAIEQLPEVWPQLDDVGPIIDITGMVEVATDFDSLIALDFETDFYGIVFDGMTDPDPLVWWGDISGPTQTCDGWTTSDGTGRGLSVQRAGAVNIVNLDCSFTAVALCLCVIE